MKRFIAFSLLLNAALLGVIAWQLATDNHNTDGQAYAADKDEIFRHMSIVYMPTDDKGGKAKTIRFSGVNVQIVNGKNKTEELNGLGNLIVGYQERRTEDLSGHDGPGITVATNSRIGSHNLVVGKENNYSKWGGQVVGYRNTISGEYSTVSGGMKNTASGYCSTVGGGRMNRAGRGATVSGGYVNRAVGYVSTVSGGKGNTASHEGATVGGGSMNEAKEFNSTVSGGWKNKALGFASTVIGGEGKTAN